MHSGNTAEVTDPILVARSRIQAGPAPEWVEECLFDAEFKGVNEWHITKLLLDRQLHAETNEDYYHEAVRLETIEAVQNLSQWRWQFEPQSQSVTLHFIRLRRGTDIIDQLNLEKGHLLQREESLNRLVMHGWFTYLQVLEDVRPGDILEWACTTHTTNRILPEFCGHFQTLPEWTAIGKYQFIVRFQTGRELKWKTSSPGLNPLESAADALSIWTWREEKYQGLKREPNTPAWYVSAPWIQISDCPEWQTVARAFAETWAKQSVDPAALDALAAELGAADAPLAERIGKAIQLVQDEYRFLSVNLESGGQTPSPPGTVAHRRYGDCKDLSFLLVNLLRRLGVEARPVLVNAQLRKSISNVLPTAGVFNHAIVEFEAEGKKRWVDPTIKRQGGGAYHRYVPDYGVGLPVDISATGLAEQPKISGLSNLYELTETILLDTRGAPSLVSMVCRAEGFQADRLRNEFAANGLEAMAKAALQKCANRFTHAKRVGELKFRDDRAVNQFYTAEIFEISGFLTNHPNGQLCQFAIPSRWIKSTLPLPEKTARRTPFALPYPCQFAHSIEINTPAAKPTGAQKITPRLALENQYLQFHRNRKAGQGYLMMNFAVTVTADSVPADQVEKHRELVESIWKASLWNYNSPVGYAKPRQGRGFGELPPPKRDPSSLPPPGIRLAAEPIPAQPPAQTAPPAAANPSEPRPDESHHRRRHRGGRMRRSQKAVLIVSAIIILVGILAVIIITRTRN